MASQWRLQNSRLGSRLLLGLGAVFLAGCLTSCHSDHRQHVRIIVGTQVLNVTYPWLTLPLALGYWRDEGYDVEVIALGPPAQPITLLAAGRADLAELNAGVAVQARVNHHEAVQVAMLNGVSDWSVGVLANSPFRKITDLKGKSIGAAGLASGGVALLRAYLQDNGMDPDKDVKIIAVGGGAPAVHALRSGRVQGLIFWAPAMAGFENAGLKLRYMRGDDWREMPDFTLAVMEDTARKDPRMVEAIVRGAAKAELFAFTNPDCARRIHWRNWPGTKPSGSQDQKVLSGWDANSLHAQLSTMWDAFMLNGGHYFGNFEPSTYGRVQDFMLKTGQIKSTVPVTDFAMAIPDFYRKANTFDAGAVRRQALACKEAGGTP